MEVILKYSAIYSIFMKYITRSTLLYPFNKRDSNKNFHGQPVSEITQATDMYPDRIPVYIGFMAN